MIVMESKGDFKKATGYLERLLEIAHLGNLNKYGRKGVEALAAATPKDTGLAADSWYYKIQNDGATASISFYNSDIENGFPVAIMLQYGHATRGGHWVDGIDYINPALRPIFEDIAGDAWKEITSL